MSLRSRIGLLVAVVVGTAIVAVSAAGWLAVRQRLIDDVDRSLQARAALVVESPEVRLLSLPERRPPRLDPDRPRPDRQRAGRGGPRDPFGAIGTYFQVIDADGSVLAQPGTGAIDLPVSTRDQQVAEAGRAGLLRDVDVDGEHLRMLTVPAGSGVAVQVATSLAELDRTLTRLGRTMALVGAAGLAVAVGAGVVITRRVLAPVSRLTDAAERVASTQDLSATIDASGNDEVGRLAESFNAMLRALADARDQQRQLVADASHELRTPLTALRTNMEVLSRAAERGELDQAWARSLMDDAHEELVALSHLVAEIVELATDAHQVDVEMVPLRLDMLVTAVADRMARRTGRAVEVTASPCTIEGSPPLLERAVTNLVDNAAKWSPADTPIEVTVGDGRVEVRDHGIGIAPEDRPRIFDRFYRSADSAGVPGSGLGLAIVRQVVERHGGEVFADEAPGGGAVVEFSLPVAANDDTRGDSQPTLMSP
jgi:two-component system, OmpR family, sensor histidine kinase MprB